MSVELIATRTGVASSDVLSGFGAFLRFHVADGDASEHTITIYHGNTAQSAGWCKDQGIDSASLARRRISPVFIIKQAKHCGPIVLVVFVQPPVYLLLLCYVLVAFLEVSLSRCLKHHLLTEQPASGQFLQIIRSFVDGAVEFAHHDLFVRRIAAQILDHIIQSARLYNDLLFRRRCTGSWRISAGERSGEQSGKNTSDARDYEKCGKHQEARTNGASLLDLL